MSKIMIKGNKLTEIRIKKGLNIRDLNKLCGVNTSILSRTENGKTTPSPKTAKKICEALEASFDELFQIVQ